MYTAEGTKERAQGRASATMHLTSAIASIITRPLVHAVVD